MAGRFTFLLLAASAIAVIVIIQNMNALSTIYIQSVPADARPLDEQTSSQQPVISYELARKQSDGFFDDIPDDEWKMMQQRHYTQFPNHGTRMQHNHDDGKVKPPKAHLFYQDHFEPEFACRHERRLGGLGDGPKWICDPHRIKKKKDCLVYSIGSAGNVLFERTIKEDISQDCEIHTFDIMTSRRKSGDFATALANYSTFHAWGISQRKQPQKKMMPLKDTVQLLGHVNRTIDIFKIDCEGCEWNTFKTWLDAGVDIRQIVVETHYSPMPAIRDFFHLLHDHGYVIFHKECNYYAKGDLVEYAFVKLSTDFFINDSLYSVYNAKTGNKR